MNTSKIIKEIIAAEIVKEEQPEEKKPNVVKPEVKIVEKTKNIVTTVPQKDVDEAIELATILIEKVNSLASELDIAMNDLSSSSSPSVLESQDDFKSLVLRLKSMKKKLMVV